jgi:hypothetical protein
MQDTSCRAPHYAVFSGLPSLHTSLRLNILFCALFSNTLLFVHVDGMRLRLWTTATYGPIVADSPGGIYDYGESRWNNVTDKEKPKNSEKSLFQRHFSHHNSDTLSLCSSLSTSDQVLHPCKERYIFIYFHSLICTFLHSTIVYS